MFIVVIMDKFAGLPLKLTPFKLTHGKLTPLKLAMVRSDPAWR